MSDVPLSEPTPSRTFRVIKDPPLLTLTFADGTPLLTATDHAWRELSGHLQDSLSAPNGMTYEVWDHERYADHSVMKVIVHRKGVFRDRKYPIHLKLWHEKGVNTFQMRDDEAQDLVRLLVESLGAQP